MTRSRTNCDREIYGVLGKVAGVSKLQQEWNQYFESNQQDAWLTRYPTTKAALPERLSEMFTFDRRAYLLGDELTEVVRGIMDELDVSVNDRVNLVINREGVLSGHYVSDFSVEEVLKLI